MKNILFIVVATLIAMQAHADPGKEINWLMDEPASLLDLGILRLKNKAK